MKAGGAGYVAGHAGHMVLASPITLFLSRDTRASVRRADRDGELHRIRPGVYARISDWRQLTPWDRYLARVHAVARTWTDAAFCLESAAALQGLPIFGEPRDIHLISGEARSWRKGDVVVHGFGGERLVGHADGYRATMPFDTAVDLCRVLPPAYALAVADTTRRRGHSGLLGDDFHAAGAAQPNRRGLRQLRWVTDRAVASAESAGESISRAVIEWLGFEAPELQVEYPHDGGVDRADFTWRGRGVIAEFDGYEKYRGATVEQTRQKIIDEKKRENRLRAVASGLARWDWTDAVTHLPLERALRAAGLTPVVPRQSAMLETLASHPRSF